MVLLPLLKQSQEEFAFCSGAGKRAQVPAVSMIAQITS